MQRFGSRFFSRQRTNHKDPAPPENEYKKEYMFSEAQAQWNDTFQESLLDFQLKFEEEETARLAGERGRLDEFNRTMAIFHDIFLKNHLRRQELYEKTDAVQEERFQKADAAREVIFVQGQQDRARTFEIEQEMRGKRVEWYNAARKEFSSDGRRKLAEKCNALNAALVEQFNRLMERRNEIGEDDTLIPVPPGGSSGSVNPQSDFSLPPSPRSPSSPSSPRAQDDLPSQPTSSESDDQQDTQISEPSSSSMRSLRASSSPNPESINSLTQPTSLDSNDQQEQEGSLRSDGVGEDKFQLYFMRSQERRQKTFLQEESERADRFRASEAARKAGESKRSTIFYRKMRQWSTKSQIEQIRGREEERFRKEVLRSNAYRKDERRHAYVFRMSMGHIMCQAYAEEDLEETHFIQQEDTLLALYERQAIQLNQRTEDLIVWLKFMRDRKPHLARRLRGGAGIDFEAAERYSVTGFAPTAILGGPLIQRALPIPKVTDDVDCNMHKRQGSFVVLKRMQEMFERSQELRARSFQRGAKDRNYTFTTNEAKREAEFVSAQQKRKELFDEAEDSRESEFEKAQQQRESEFQANERKREDDFDKNEAERDDEARKAHETRAQRFQSMMFELQQDYINNEEGRLKELELLGEELIMSREQGMPLSYEKFPRRFLRGSA